MEGPSRLDEAVSEVRTQPVEETARHVFRMRVRSIVGPQLAMGNPNRGRAWRSTKCPKPKKKIVPFLSHSLLDVGGVLHRPPRSTNIPSTLQETSH